MPFGRRAYLTQAPVLLPQDRVFKRPDDLDDHLEGDPQPPLTLHEQIEAAILADAALPEADRPREGLADDLRLIPFMLKVLQVFDQVLGPETIIQMEYGGDVCLSCGGYTIWRHVL